jgi:hypothetical protein
VGAHDRLGRAVAGGREQFERTAAVGLEAVARAAKRGHEVAAAVVDLVGRIPSFLHGGHKQDERV